MDTKIVPQNENENKTQLGPPYVCFTCGAPSTGIRCYLEFLSPRAIPKPLDTWGEYIWYLWLPQSCREAGHSARVVRLNDAIAPLAQATIERVQAALAVIAAAHGPNPKADPAASIVWQLVAGTITPADAIARIGALCHQAVVGALETEPVLLHWQEAAQ